MSPDATADQRPPSPGDAGGACANCGDPGTLISAHAQIAPFFAKRVHGVEVASLREVIDYRLAALPAPLPRRLLGLCADAVDVALGGALRQSPPLRARARVCTACGFVGPEHDYTERELLGLYADYRSDQYNTDRIRYEPGYARIAALVGRSDAEVRARQSHLDQFLRDHVPPQSLAGIGDVLDWGGGEGRFVPEQFANRRVVILDVSSEAPIDPGFRRVSDPGELPTDFDYIQLCHVVEHVGAPGSLVRTVAGFLRPGGYLYLEAPQDIDDDGLRRLRRRDPSRRHMIHEHLNLYSLEALEALGAAADLEVVAVARRELDMGRSRAMVVSGLFRRP